VKHKGYEAVVGYDEDDRIFTGRVIDTQDVIAFDGASVAELETAFQAVIDEYLEDCTRIGKQPNKPFSGKFVVRIPPEDHRAAVVAAEKAGVSLNAWAADALRKAAHEERA
jgi:predicted HicB family RNase H-like nuclease